MKKSIDALLLSAGYSGRMGEFKPLLKLNDKPFIIIIIEKLLKVCENIVIVTGFRNEDVELAICNWIDENPNYKERLKIVYNENFFEGMFTSIKKGISQLKNSKWILFHFVDQPFLPNEFYFELVNQIEEDYDWVQPVFNLTNGHPVIFKNTVFDRVLNSPNNFKMMLIRDSNETKKKYWVTNYSEILKDIDTKEDLENILEN